MPKVSLVAFVPTDFIPAPGRKLEGRLVVNGPSRPTEIIGISACFEGIIKAKVDKGAHGTTRSIQRVVRPVYQKLLGDIFNPETGQFSKKGRHIPVGPNECLELFFSFELPDLGKPIPSTYETPKGRGSVAYDLTFRVSYSKGSDTVTTMPVRVNSYIPVKPESANLHIKFENVKVKQRNLFKKRVGEFTAHLCMIRYQLYAGEKERFFRVECIQNDTSKYLVLTVQLKAHAKLKAKGYSNCDVYPCGDPQIIATVPPGGLVDKDSVLEVTTPLVPASFSSAPLDLDYIYHLKVMVDSQAVLERDLEVTILGTPQVTAVVGASDTRARFMEALGRLSSSELAGLDQVKPSAPPAYDVPSAEFPGLTTEASSEPREEPLVVQVAGNPVSEEADVPGELPPPKQLSRRISSRSSLQRRSSDRQTAL